MSRAWRIKILLLIIGPLFISSSTEKGFKADQLNNSRVRAAFEYYEVDLQTKLRLKSINKDRMDIYIRAFKMEEIVEVWAKNRTDKMYQMVSNYKFCNNIGRLGPKREQGDEQIPEGLYKISAFNPNSNYHLSLKINYPNKSDSILGNKYNYGGNIFLHGGCATIGCIPITDDWIKELYVLAVLAKDGGQENIPVHIFPARMNAANMQHLKKGDYPTSHIVLWNNLKDCYTYFEKYGFIPRISINNRSGRYMLYAIN